MMHWIQEVGWEILNGKFSITASSAKGKCSQSFYMAQFEKETNKTLKLDERQSSCTT